jgi:GxxExxY protein
MIKSEYRHSELTAKIIGAAIKVHNTFSLGFPESVYKNSLIIELRKDAALKIEMEVEAMCIMKGNG